MSNYPDWWADTITIYNRVEDVQTQVVKWYRHVVNNCFWKNVGNKVHIGDVTLETNDIICRIPKSDEFLEKYKWLNIPNDHMEDYFTLGEGDIIIKGEVDDEINEYEKGKRSSDLIAKYKKLQGCMEIQQVANNTGTGLPIEHYHVRGT